MGVVLWLGAFVAGVGLIVWGAEAFAEHLGRAAVRLRISTFALALLLAGAEPEELATAVVASLRGSPGIALGDVVGANVTICLVALGVGAWIAPVPFGVRVMRYALLGLPLGMTSAWFVWDGTVGRVDGVILVGLYVLYVGVIWWAERKPPTLGEVGELEEAEKAELAGRPARVGHDLLMVMAGVVAMAVGAAILVESIQRISGVEKTQTRLGLTLVGLATGFELVVLAWSSARRGMSDAVVAGVVGSFAYNVTMTLGAGALAHPLALADPSTLHLPLVLMLASLATVILLAVRRSRLGRIEAIMLLALYPVFLAAVLD